MALTQVTSAGLKDGEIVNADLHSAAAIALSKLSTSGTAGSGNYLRGDGAWTAIDLTALSASSLTSGTVAAARLDTATTQSAGNSSTKIATTAFVSTAVTNLIGGAPGALDTLNELAAAINDDASYASTITTALGTKLPLAGGTMTGAINLNSNNITNGGTITGTFSGNITGNVTGNASTADAIDTTSSNNDLTHYLTFVDSSSSTAGETLRIYSNLKCNPNSGLIEATTFSGSGASLTNVNATTLDSIDSGSFLRSDANDTMSSQLSLTRSGAYPLVINGADNGKIVLEGSSSPYIRFREGSTDKAYIQWGNDGYFYLVNQEEGDYLMVGGGASGLKWHRDGELHTVWTSGNDGLSSGLDADLLDGVQGASYLRSDANDSYSGTLNLNGLYFEAGNVGQNLKLRGSVGSTTDVGLSLYNSNNAWCCQLYGTNGGSGAQYGFLNSNWGSWDLWKNPDGQAYVRVSGSNYQLANATNIGSGGVFSGQNFYVNYLYTNNWIYFQSNDGLYWNGGTANGWHMWPLNAYTMRFRSTHNSTCILALANSGNSTLGAVYADANGIGFTDTAENWAFRTNRGTNNAYLYDQNFSSDTNNTYSLGSNGARWSKIYAQNAARAWINVDGDDSTANIRASYGVSSLSDDAYERHTVNFSENFGNTNYCFVTGARAGSSGGGGRVVVGYDAPATSYFKYQMRNLGNNNEHVDAACLSFFGT